MPRRELHRCLSCSRKRQVCGLAEHGARQLCAACWAVEWADQMEIQERIVERLNLKLLEAGRHIAELERQLRPEDEPDVGMPGRPVMPGDCLPDPDWM